MKFFYAPWALSALLALQERGTILVPVVPSTQAIHCSYPIKTAWAAEKETDLSGLYLLGREHFSP